MKLKRRADDFVVEERIALPAAGGPYALYQLTKQSLGTLEAVDAIRRRWKLRPAQVAFAGLKDKHARTTQYITIDRGPRRGLAETNWHLEYVGQTPRPIHASDIEANRFTVVLRDLTPQDRGRGNAASASEAFEGAVHEGVANYFDNQRFGSLGEAGEFIARPWCLGDYERALWLALVDPNVHDRPEERETKRLLGEHWGDWTACVRFALRSPANEIAAYLARQPGDFRRAIALFPAELRGLWLAAFQSDLWNTLLAARLREVCATERLVERTIGRRTLPLVSALDDRARQTLGEALPLPSARLHLEDGPLSELYGRVLAAEGIALRQLRVKYPRDSFFSKGERACLFFPAEPRHEAADDELYPGRQKLTLSFTLGRGSYATILIKQIAADACEAGETV